MELIREFAKARGLTQPRDIIQAMIKEYFEAQGKLWPEDRPAWGGKRAGSGRKKAAGLPHTPQER